LAVVFPLVIGRFWVAIWLSQQAAADANMVEVDWNEGASAERQLHHQCMLSNTSSSAAAMILLELNPGP